MVATQNALAAERRATDLDVDLAEVRSEVARLELEIKRNRAEDRLDALAKNSPTGGATDGTPPTS